MADHWPFLYFIRNCVRQWRATFMALPYRQLWSGLNVGCSVRRYFAVFLKHRSDAFFTSSWRKCVFRVPPPERYLAGVVYPVHLYSLVIAWIFLSGFTSFI